MVVTSLPSLGHFPNDCLGQRYTSFQSKMAGIEPLDFEEDISTGRSSRSDTKFDTVVGHIEDIIMEEAFQSTMNSFMEKHYHHFEDVEENKLIYTNIFTDYVDLVEKYIHDGLNSRIAGFSMDDFLKSLKSRQDQIGEEIFDMLTSFTDFLAFKQMMLDYKCMKEGRSLDLGDLLTVTSAKSQADEQDHEMQVDPQTHRDIEPDVDCQDPGIPPNFS